MNEPDIMNNRYLKALSACPLNWNDKPANECKVIEEAVNSCYFPLYEVEQEKQQSPMIRQRPAKKFRLKTGFP